MSDKPSQVKVFRHYDIVVFAVFSVILILAATIGYYQYHVELESTKREQYSALAEKMSGIDLVLHNSQQSLRGMRDFAQYYLQNPDEQYHPLPQLVQSSGQYHLKAQSRDIFNQSAKQQNNITGAGQISQFSEDHQEELAMAYALAPAFVTASNNNPDATWFYYLSASRFISIYPWIRHDVWQYTDQMLEKPFYKQILHDDGSTEEFIWSLPFSDSAGTGIIASVSTRVFQGAELKGVLVIDLDLDSIKQMLPDLKSDQQGFVLINEKGDVLVHKEYQEKALQLATTWQDIAPAQFLDMSFSQLQNIEQSLKKDEWYIQKFKLAANDWSIIKYERYSNLSSAIINRIALVLSLFSLGLITFLTLVFVITRRSFVNPAKDFISHIEYCAQGDLGKVSPPKDWRPWFEIVENIFSENRRLLQQLTEQNTELDNRVAEKTKALQDKSKQHQRDYLLLRSVINAIPEMIIFNDKDGHLIGCNKAFEDFIAIEEQRLFGTSVSALLPLPIRQCLQTFYSRENDLQGRGFSKTVETTKETYNVFCTGFYNEKGESLGSITVLHNVTEQFAAQNALKMAKDQAEHANKAKSQFLANMSHEIRTPINAITGMMSLIDNTHLSALQHQYLDKAQSAAGALLHLIDELLDLSRIEAGKLAMNIADASIDRLVENAIQLNILAAEKKGLTLAVDIDSSVPQVVKTDELRLTQVLSNLINNAVKFTHQGQVKLRIGVDAKDTEQLNFSVTDTGIGIAQDKQSKLFDAFIQADDSMTREYGGSGLGLSICKEIIEQLGGQLQLKSALGKGSEFSFSLSPECVSSVTLDLSSYQIQSLGTPIEKCFASLLEDYQGRIEFCSKPEDLVEFVGKQQLIFIDLSNLNLFESQLSKLLSNSAKQNVKCVIFHHVSEEFSPALYTMLDNLPCEPILISAPVYRYSLLKVLSKELHSQESIVKKSVSSAKVHNAPQKVNSKKTAYTDKLSGTNVLLVEDNLVNQMVASELLQAMGATVEIAEHGQEAVDKVSSTAFDVILMDIQMPVMDGLSAAKAIRQLPQAVDIPIIAMTAHAREEDKNTSLAAGMNMHVAKPVTTELLYQSINDVLMSSK